ncbi:MAG: ATP-binding protein [Limisphaerales bacterium]
MRTWAGNPLPFAWLCPLLALGITLLAAVSGRADESASQPDGKALNSLRQLRLAVSQDRRQVCSFQIEGVVRAASVADGVLFLQDDTEAGRVELDWGGAPLHAGERVRLRGTSTPVARSEGGVRLGRVPVVDVDGSHPPIRDGGQAYLVAGHNPIRVEWFNDVLGVALEVEYAGPGLTRRKIPASALFRPVTEGAATPVQWVPGLDFRCFEGAWNRLPDFSRLTPVRTGVATNFDLSLRTRPERVGLEFTGALAVPRAGFYTFYLRSDDGARLFVAEPLPQLAVLGQAPLPPPRRLQVGEVLLPAEEFQWSAVEGELTFIGERGGRPELELSAEGGNVRLQVANDRDGPPPRLLNSRVRATGVCQGSASVGGRIVLNSLLLPDWSHLEVLAVAPEFQPVPETNTVLTTAAQVQRLTREQAQLGYRVKLRGVVTHVTPNYSSLVIQDATRGIYVTHYAGGWKTGVPEVGEAWEIEGISDPQDFAPVVRLRKATRLGAGRLPEPVRPTWDQLINGSLDAQYVELQGIITAVRGNRVTLLMRVGQIDVTLADHPPEGLARLEDALVRIRGCLFAVADRDTHRVLIDSGIQIGNPSLAVDEPAPSDPFTNAVRKSASELLHFDPQASAFQRVKLTGQILHRRNNMYFLTDGMNGVRFLARRNIVFEPGDRVEVVGLPQLGGPSPVLREAVARKTGRAPLPPARNLAANNWFPDGLDSTRVSIQGLLVNWQQRGAEQIFEIQSGLRTFVARLDQPGAAPRPPAIGSRLELTGVYSAQAGTRAEFADAHSFELLLNDSADVHVLARPPWWTPQRLLLLAGLLLGVLALAVVWINVLHRQVEKRTRQLHREIHEREQAEQRQAIEAERTRIARDIHDELGCSLAQIRLLSEMTLTPGQPPEEVQASAGKISGKALEAARVMDEIVWAVDPQHDTLESLLSYVCNFASDYLALAGIRFRIDAPAQVPPRALKTQTRHHLFMALKEALNNVVNHSGASEVWLRFRLENGAACFIIEDNGRGFERTAGTEAAPGASGLTNMRKRLGDIGGECVLESAAGQGTRVKFTLPLEPATIS